MIHDQAMLAQTNDFGLCLFQIGILAKQETYTFGTIYAAGFFGAGFFSTGG